MRPILCNIVMLSVLFMSLDGAIDIARQGHPHKDDPGQQLDASPAVSSEASSDTDRTPDSEHSEHCCHGHLASIVMQLPPLAFMNAAVHPSTQTAYVVERAQAPPTPPPIA